MLMATGTEHDEGPLSEFKEIEDEIMYEARADTATHRMEDLIREFQGTVDQKVATKAERVAKSLQATNIGYFDAVTKVLEQHMTHMQLLEFKQQLREMHAAEGGVLASGWDGLRGSWRDAADTLVDKVSSCFDMALEEHSARMGNRIHWLRGKYEEKLESCRVASHAEVRRPTTPPCPPSARRSPRARSSASLG